MITHVNEPSTSGNSMQIFAMGAQTGQLPKTDEVSPGKAACPACTDPERRHFYVGAWEGEIAGIVSSNIDAESGDLTRLGEVPLEGHACYLATDRTGSYILASNYLGCMVTTHRIGQDGVAVGV